MPQSSKTFRVGFVLFLCFSVAVYSMSSFFTKLASGYGFLSLPYIICLAGAVIVLCLYAVLWQIALKRVPLNVAYPFRSLSIVLGLAIAYWVFNENITWQNILGSTIVISGLIIITTNK